MLPADQRGVKLVDDVVNFLECFVEQADIRRVAGLAGAQLASEIKRPSLAISGRCSLGLANKSDSSPG